MSRKRKPRGTAENNDATQQNKAQNQPGLK